MNVYFKIVMAATISFMISLAVYIPLVLFIERLELLGMMMVPKWLVTPTVILFFFALVAIFYTFVAGRIRIHHTNPEIEAA